MILQNEDLKKIYNSIDEKLDDLWLFFTDSAKPQARQIDIDFLQLFKRKIEKIEKHIIKNQGATENETI